MTSTDPAPAGAPGAGAVPGTVFRSELNPVGFLQRAAYLYPECLARMLISGEPQRAESSVSTSITTTHRPHRALEPNPPGGGAHPP